MNYKHSSFKMGGGFSSLEIFLTIFILIIWIGVTIAIVIPMNRMSKAMDSQRHNDVDTIYRAVQRYHTTNGVYPITVADDSKLYGICSATVYSDTPAGCGDPVNIAKLLPVYLPEIPRDPLSGQIDPDTMYKIAINEKTGVYVEASNTEKGQGEGRTVVFTGQPPEGYTVPTIDRGIGDIIDLIITK